MTHSEEIKKALMPIIDEAVKPLKTALHQIAGNRILEYVIEKTKTLQYTKTLLSPTDIPLKEIYYHIPLNFNGYVVYPKTVNDYFEHGNKVLITGDGGGGKTTIINYTFINSYHEFGKVPVLYNLRELSRYQHEEKKKRGINDIQDNILFTALLNHLLFNKVGVSFEAVLSMFDTGKFIFILEGYDELPKNYDIAVEIKEFLERFPENRYLITTRPYSSASALSGFVKAELMGLDIKKDIEPFIRKQLSRNTNGLADRVIKEVSKPNNKEYLELLSNPLFLILFINSFDFHPSLPRKKSDFYFHLFDALFGKHDSLSKDGFERPRYSVLTKSKFIGVLNTFCFRTFFSEMYEFSLQEMNIELQDTKVSMPVEFEIDDYIKDLKESVPLIVEVGQHLKFVHRTLQEYFAALFIISQNEEDYKGIAEFLLESDQIRPNIFLLELLAELKEHLYNRYFLLPYLSSFFNDYNIVVLSEETDYATAKTVLSVFADFQKLLSFSDILRKEQEAFLRHRYPQYPTDNAYFAAAQFEEDSNLLRKLFILCRNHQTFMTQCNAAISSNSVRNRNFIQRTLR
ncbi:MAG TPA: hypothetical protein VK796_12035 [Cytophaga sp.]|jgi:hypothetical protein|nr:hypothetical protein [Cytophaga sp.]